MIRIWLQFGKMISNSPDYRSTFSIHHHDNLNLSDKKNPTKLTHFFFWLSNIQIEAIRFALTQSKSSHIEVNTLDVISIWKLLQLICLERFDVKFVLEHFVEKIAIYMYISASMYYKRQCNICRKKKSPHIL